MSFVSYVGAENEKGEVLPHNGARLKRYESSIKSTTNNNHRDTMKPSIHQVHHRRRLDDYYSFSDDTLKQHPWYSHSMLIVLAGLVLIVIGYAMYQIYFTAKDCEKNLEPICNGAYGSPDEDDGIDPDKQEPKAAWKVNPEMEMAGVLEQTRRRIDEYVNMPDPLHTKGVSA